MQLRNSIKGV